MEKRDEILLSARELFCSRGYDAVGVQEIAENAGVTKPTLYYYFKSKYGLLEVLLNEGCEPFLARLEKVSRYEGDLLRTLCGSARVFMDFAADDIRLYRIFLSSYHSPWESEAYRAASPIAQRQQQLIRSIFEHAAGQLGNMNGRQHQFALGFSGLVHYYIIMKLEEQPEGPFSVSDAEIYSLVHQFMHGIYS